jgi:hypothetical protein
VGRVYIEIDPDAKPGEKTGLNWVRIFRRSFVCNELLGSFGNIDVFGAGCLGFFRNLFAHHYVSHAQRGMIGHRGEVLLILK